ncbi:MAG: hypothetical protein ACR2P0_15885 [Acidimicrobiales bacterium]
MGTPIHVPPPPRAAAPRPSVDIALAATAHFSACAVAGALAGFVWGGIGGRIAMRIVFLTSGDRVRGLTSDDGFEIGIISGNTIFLIAAMTVVGGFVGAFGGFFRMLPRSSPRTLAAGAAVAVGASAGATLVHTDGVDFRLLEPLWLTVGLFVFLPAAWAATVVLVADRIVHHDRLAPNLGPAIDSRPAGLAGHLVVWAGMVALTILGIVDLVNDVRVLN